MDGVTISNGNSKMGSIKSVSLPAVLTCRKDCKCIERCYALKIERLRPNVRNSYRRNLEVLKKDKAKYWREVEAAIMTSRLFRFHVSGDIPDGDYFENMIAIAKRNTHCEILCFTKQFEIVNKELRNLEAIGEKPPQNLHIIFSAWKDLVMDNPFSLPEAHVLYKDGSTTARDDAKLCGGNCTECATTDGGCWTLKYGEQVVFKIH